MYAECSKRRTPHREYQTCNERELDGGKNAPEVKELLDAYKTIPLDYVNVHFKVGSSGFSPGELRNIADYTRNYTGKDVLSNEMHSPPMISPF